MEASSAQVRVRWLAGPSGGGWFDLAQDIARELQQHASGLRIDVLPGGGFDNPLAVDRGDADLAMTVDFLARAAIAGTPPYEQPMPNVEILVDRLSALPFHLLLRTAALGNFESAIRRPGFRIAIPDKNTADELTFRLVMAFYGESYASIVNKGGLVIHGAYTDIAEAFCRGEVDYLFGATTSPANVIRLIANRSRDAKLDSLPVDLTRHLVDSHGYLPMQIPAETYSWSVRHDVATVGFGTVLIASKHSGGRYSEASREAIRKHVDRARAAAGDQILFRS